MNNISRYSIMSTRMAGCIALAYCGTLTGRSKVPSVHASDLCRNNMQGCQEDRQLQEAGTIPVQELREHASGSFAMSPN